HRHASRPDEPGRGDRQRRRRRQPLGDPRAGRDRRGGTHGRARRPVAQPAQRAGADVMAATKADRTLPAGRTLFVNAHLVDPATGLDETGDLLVEDGVIAATGVDIVAPDGDVETIDCAGHLLCPGLIDMRVFTGEPGNEHRETLASASEAAAAGGVTTVICMPNR